MVEKEKEEKKEEEKEKGKSGKKGGLKLTDLILMGLANIVGAGIFVILGKSIKYGGNKAVGALLMVASISMIMGFCYIEIYSRYESTITEYLAIKNTMGEFMGQISLYAIYLFALFSGVTIVTSISKYISKSGFLNSFLNKENTKMFEVVLSISLLVVMSGINYMGIETSTFFANTVSIVMIIVLGGVILLGGRFINVEDVFIKPPSLPSGSFIISAILSLFLFNGYDFLVKISGESENKADNKTALIASISITTIIYFLIIAVALSVLKFKISSTTYNLISKLYEVLTNKPTAMIVYFVGIFIMFNTAFLSVMSATKFIQGCGKEKNIHFPDFWAKESINKSPVNAIIVSFIICLLLAIVNNEVLMTVFTNFTCVLTLILLSVAVLLIRWNERNDEKTQKLHNFIPGNIGNIPVIVAANLAVLIGVMFLMLKNKFWIGVV